MDLKEAQISAKLKAEEDALKLSRTLLNNYNMARADIIAKLDSVYAKYLSTTDPKDYYNIMIQYDRLNNMLSDVDKLYAKQLKKAGVNIEQISGKAMEGAYYRQQYVLTWADPRMTFSMIKPELIELSVTGTTEAWKKIGAEMAKDFVPKYGTLKNVIAKNDFQALANIRQEITQGFIQGKSTKDMAEAINGRIDTDAAKALRIAQTEANRTANAGAYAASLDAEEQGIKITRMWLAALDSETRDSHAELDGQEVGVDEPFSIHGAEAMFPGDFGIAEEDINCRCTVVDLVNGEKPEYRMGRDPLTEKNEVFEWKNYAQWAKDNKIGE